MSTPKRATVYFEADVHRALRLRAAANDRSVSDMVNDAVKVALAEDAVDLALHEHQLELAGEYLLMAALLIEIKSRMLLPRRAKTEEGEVDPRAELVRRLIEYERMKRAAQSLNEMPQAGRDFSLLQVRSDTGPDTRLPEVNPDDLRSAWLGLIARAQVSRHHKITREQLSVREHMSRILRVLQPLRFVRFEDLFDTNAGVPVLVVNFLAVLELDREALIQVTQQGAYAPIYVKSNHGLATV